MLFQLHSPFSFLDESKLHRIRTTTNNTPETKLDHVQRTGLTGDQQSKQTPIASKIANYNRQLPNKNQTDYDRM
jgi:hypothetical protein